MAYTQLCTAQSGRQYYRIRCYITDSKELSKRWYVPDGWSEKTIKRELNKVAAEFEKQCLAGEVLSRTEKKEKAAEEAAAAAAIQTVKEYSEKVFMPTKRIQCKENTRQYYQNMLDAYILPVIGSVKMPEVSSAQLSALLLKVQSAGLSHSTAIGVYVTLNQLFKMAYMADLIDRNPVDKVSRPTASKEAAADEDGKYFSEDELLHIIECLDADAEERNSLKWKAFVRLMIVTGCRRGELCGLRWKSVDFNSSTIKVENNLCYSGEKGVYNETPKGRKNRVVSVDEDVMQILQDYKKEMESKSNVASLNGYVFVQHDGITPIHPQSPDRFFQRFGERYQINDFHPHKLRHSFASVAITNGADVASVSRVLGHADEAITLRRYTHANLEAQKRASGVFTSALKAKKAENEKHDGEQLA